MGHQHIRRDCQISSLLLGSGTDRDRRPRARQSLRNLAKSTRVEHAAGTPLEEIGQPESWKSWQISRAYACHQLQGHPAGQGSNTANLNVMALPRPSRAAATHLAWPNATTRRLWQRYNE